MLKRTSHTLAHVLDHDEALDFYVGKLGLVVHTDADLGAMRTRRTGPRALGRGAAEAVTR